MKANKTWIGLGILLTLFVMSGHLPAVAGDEVTCFKADVKPGFEVVGTSELEKTSDGVPSRKVGEYEVMDEGVRPTFEFSMCGVRSSGKAGKDHITFGGNYLEDEEQSYYLDVDFRRLVRQEIEYDRFQHWLGHDPLDNLNAVFSPGDPHVVTTHTDYDAGKDYQLVHSETNSSTAVALPFIPGGEIAFDYRREVREGYRQSLTMSKCTACHVQSHSREIDEITEDYSPSVKAKFGKARGQQLALEYSFLYRDFKERGATPTNLYDEAINPRNPASKPFGDRVWYENVEKEYDQVPDMEKEMHRVKAEGTMPDINTTVFAGYVNSNVENTDAHIETDSDTASFRISNTSIAGLAVSAGFRWLDIDNDDYLVDYTEPTGTNPDYSGTYRSYYGVGGAGEGTPPFTWPFDRESALSRDTYTADFNARYTLTPGLTLRGSYKWEKIDRDNFLVDEGETETEKDTYTVGANARLGSVRTRVRYTYQDVDYPFASSTASGQGGACEADDSQGVTGNWRLGKQYYEFWATREQDMSNLPDEKHEVVANLTYPIKHNLTLTGHYRWQDEDTTSGEGEVHMPSVSLWYALHPKLNFMLTYLYDDETRESRICLPVFNG